MPSRFAVCAASLLAACAAPLPRDDDARNPLTLTKEHFAVSTSVQEGLASPVATFSTVNGYRRKFGEERLVRDDSFLRAFVHKQTGVATYQVCQIIQYEAETWKGFDTAEFATSAGSQQRRLTLLSRDADCADRGRRGGCSFREQLGFELDEAQLQAIAAQNTGSSLWRIRFSARSGDEYMGGLLPAEAAGLLERVRAYRTNKTMPSRIYK